MKEGAAKWFVRMSFYSLGVAVLCPQGPIMAAVLSGRVSDQSAHHSVKGVRIEVVEAGRSATTTSSGLYRISDLPPGHYTLRISIPGSGAKPVEQPVDIGDEVELIADIALSPSAPGQEGSLPVILVTSSRIPLEISRAAEFQAPNVISMMTAEEIRKLPDVSAAEAVRRLPGVSAENDTGEARFINIRGLDADLNGTTFAGVRLLPTNPSTPLGGGRAVAFDTIPAGIIGAIVVTKTNTPDMDAEALGGTIELTPKRLGANDPSFLSGRAGSGYEPLRGSKLLDLEIAGGTRFDFGGGEKSFSAAGSIAYYVDSRGIDDLEGSYVDGQSSGVPDKAFNDLQQRWYYLHRKRLGFGGELAYEPSERHRWYLDAYQSGYVEDQFKDYLVINFSGAPAAVVGAPNALTDTVDSFDRKETDHTETLRSRLLSLGGRDLIGNSTLDYRVSYTEGRYTVSKDYGWDFQAPGGASITYDNTTHPNWPAYSIGPGFASPYDPAAYALSDVSTGSEKDRDREYAGVINWAMPLNLWGDSDEIKLGVSARLRDKVLAPVQTTFTGDSIPAVTLAPFVNSRNLRFYDSHYTNGYEFNGYALEAYYPSALANGLVEDVAGDTLANEQSYQHNKEDIYAVYGQYKATLGALGLLAGVRVESTHASYAANVVTFDADGNPTSVILNTPKNSYTNAFPTFQARYEIAPKFIARASLSSAIARPGFQQITGAAQLSPSTQSITQGNPSLRPTTGYNLDLGLERYFDTGGTILIGAFDKELRNYIVGTGLRVPGSSLPQNSIYGAFAGDSIVNIQSFTNISQARVAGLEFAVEQRFKDLPGFLSGLGAGANWTWVSSRGALRPGISAPLPSTARNTANADVFYEAHGLELKIAGYYTSRVLFQPNTDDATGYTDVYQSQRLAVDFGSSYSVSKNTGVYVNVKNLTDNPMRYTEGPENRPIQREFYGVTVQAGINLNF
jgi:TonB-dependent receptor